MRHILAPSDKRGTGDDSELDNAGFDARPFAER